MKAANILLSWTMKRQSPAKQ